MYLKINYLSFHGFLFKLNMAFFTKLNEKGVKMRYFAWIILFSLFTQTVSAQEVRLLDFNYSLSDVSKLGLTSGKLFSEMNRSLIKVGDSICSNRALIWNYDLKRNHEINSAKIFLFYAQKDRDFSFKKWWYHVAPVINFRGNLLVMDAGFPGLIHGPLKISDWLSTFAQKDNCREIKSNETELIELIYSGRQFPSVTSYGKHDCYMIIAPAGYWTPSSVAKHLLGKDEDGQTVSHIRDEIDMDELYQACVEAVTTPLGRVLGSGENRCKKYLNYEPLISNN